MNYNVNEEYLKVGFARGKGAVGKIGESLVVISLSLGGAGSCRPVTERIYLSTLVVPPFITFSTSAREAVVVSPGVVMARAPWAAP